MDRTLYLKYRKIAITSKYPQFREICDIHDIKFYKRGFLAIIPIKSVLQIILTFHPPDNI